MTNVMLRDLDMALPDVADVGGAQLAIDTTLRNATR